MSSATRRSALSKTLFALLAVIILVAAVSGVVLALRPTGSRGTPFSSSKQFLSDTYFGYLLNNSKTESPVGIASYGIYNDSGSLRSYSINSSEVVGQAVVGSIAALTTWNDSLSPYFSSLSCVQCATLQMNVNVIVQTKKGEQVFWIQNGLPFVNTITHEVLKPEGIIWNQTTINSNITFGVVGVGGLPNQLSGKIVFGSLSYGGPEVSYTLPLSVKMTTSIQTTSNGIRISLSNDPFGNGTFARDNDTYLSAYLPIKNVTSASIVVTTSLYPWRYNLGLYPTFDSELVWTGYCCAQTTEFTEMNSNLSLSYLNSNGQLLLYPSFYTFGDVEETANNLAVIPTQTGGHVIIGENNNTFLGN